MSQMRLSFPVTNITVDAEAVEGPLETWRHTVGHGGVNPLPLPERVVDGIEKLHPRLIRIFIQEFFDIYPEQGRFDWSKLAPYMDALARTGAKIVAAITIKPRAIFPEKGESHWRPGSEKEWQHVVAELVRHYSVERQLVTHWEIGNEPDIGERGGCPYLISDPQDYGEFYSMTIRPIIETFPQAKVGGPAVAGVHRELLPGFIRYCLQTNTQLDFVSWHVYDSVPSVHAHCVRFVQLLTRDFPDRRPELMVTEWNRQLGEKVSIEDHAFAPRRAAVVAMSILGMMKAGLDWSFYYHLWDQVCFPETFAQFFSEKGVANMAHHWNETPHRLGLFGVSEEVRPQYFVYWMLSSLGTERLVALGERDVGVLSGRTKDRISVMAINHSIEERCDRVVALHFSNLQPGVKRLTVYRIDRDRRWCPETLELKPVECRDVSTGHEFECHVLLPSDSVAMVSLSRAL